MQYCEIPTDELLRQCLANADADAWSEFVKRFHKVIAGVAIRVSAGRDDTPLTADDLVQDVLLKLCADNCRLLRNFKPSGPDSLYGYIKVVTVNIVNDFLRARIAIKRGSGVDAEPITETDTLPSAGSG